MKILIILAILFIILNKSSCVKVTKRKTTSKTTTKTKLESKRTFNSLVTTTTTKETLKNLNNSFECYQTFQGFLNGHYYNSTKLAECNTNCESYKFKSENRYDTLSSCNQAKECIGGFYKIMQGYVFEYDCCFTDKCNSEILSDKLLEGKCEFKKKVDKSKRLVYPVASSNDTNVTQCYYCAKCDSKDSISVVSCGRIDNSSKLFACQVFKF